MKDMMLNSCAKSFYHKKFCLQQVLLYKEFIGIIA